MLACEKPALCVCHCSLSCTLGETDHWLLTAFSLTHCSLLLQRKFPLLQPVNCQLPSSGRPFLLHLWFSVPLSLSVTRHLMNGWRPFVFNPSGAAGGRCKLCRCFENSLQRCTCTVWRTHQNLNIVLLFFKLIFQKTFWKGTCFFLLPFPENYLPPTGTEINYYKFK